MTRNQLDYMANRETVRHNTQMEMENWRHNTKMERIDRRNAKSNRMNAKSNRMNAKSNRMQAKASKSQAKSAAKQAAASLSQAETARENAVSNRIQAYASSTQAKASMLQAGAAQKNAETNYRNSKIQEDKIVRDWNVATQQLRNESQRIGLDQDRVEGQINRWLNQTRTDMRNAKSNEKQVEVAKKNAQANWTKARAKMIQASAGAKFDDARRYKTYVDTLDSVVEKMIKYGDLIVKSMYMLE